MGSRRTPTKLFYKIGEVCELAGIKPHVLRYWESEFPALRPRKNRGGQRVYQPKDLDMVFRIKRMLHEEGYTIAGAKKKLKGGGDVDSEAAGDGAGGVDFSLKDPAGGPGTGDAVYGEPGTVPESGGQAEFGFESGRSVEEELRRSVDKNNNALKKIKKDIIDLLESIG